MYGFFNNQAIQSDFRENSKISKYGQFSGGKKKIYAKFINKQAHAKGGGERRKRR